MLLEITTTHKPATDLGFLLHKHPDKLQTTELSVGNAYVFYPEANEDFCTACLVVDINPLELVRSKNGNPAFLQEHYVNDRPYTANSFFATALVKAFGSALNGNCQNKPELAETAIPLKVKLCSLKIEVSPDYLEKLFGPLGYKMTLELLPLDIKFPSWGMSRYVNLYLEHTIPLKDMLSHLYVFMLALDNDRHYWVTKNDVDVLLRRGGNWLESHPEKEWIIQRYLRNLKTFTSEALVRLAGEQVLEESAPSEKKTGLHQKRLNKAFEFLKESGAESVVDIGCGEGKLIKLLLKESQFKRIAGMDVSFGELQKARENLHLDRASPFMKERLQLFQGSVTYKDDRLKGYDAAVLVEVIEHLDPERLSAMEKVVFGNAKPATIVLSTPNAEYNLVYEKLDPKTFRHDDHRFEWTRKEFREWCEKVCKEFGYQVTISPVGEEEANLGSPSQMAVFKRK